MKNEKNYMIKKLSEIDGVIFNSPDAAFYIFASLPVDDTDLFAKWLLEKFRYNNKTVMFAPGNGFYSKKNAILGKNEVRFSFCGNNIEEIEEGMEILKIAIKKYNEER